MCASSDATASTTTTTTENDDDVASLISAPASLKTTNSPSIEEKKGTIVKLEKEIHFIEEQIKQIKTTNEKIGSGSTSVGDEIIKFDLHLIKLYNDLGYVYYGINNMKEADVNFQKGIELIKSCKKQSSFDNSSEETISLLKYHTANILFNQGLAFNKCKEYEEAFSKFDESLTLKEALYKQSNKESKNSIQQITDLAQTYNNIGTLYCKLEDYKKSESMFNKSLLLKYEIYAANKNNDDVAGTLHNLAVCYVNMDKYTEALKYYKLALSILLKIYPTKYEQMQNPLIKRIQTRITIVTAYKYFFNKTTLTVFVILCGWYFKTFVMPFLTPKNMRE